MEFFHFLVEVLSGKPFERNSSIQRYTDINGVGDLLIDNISFGNINKDILVDAFFSDNYKKSIENKKNRYKICLKKRCKLIEFCEAGESLFINNFVSYKNHDVFCYFINELSLHIFKYIKSDKLINNKEMKICRGGV